MCSEEGRFELTSASFESIFMSGCRNRARDPLALTLSPCLLCTNGRHHRLCDSRYTKEHSYHTIISPDGNPLVGAWNTELHADTEGPPIQSTFAAQAVHSCRMRDLLGCAGVNLIGKATLHIIPRAGRGLAVVVADGREFCTSGLQLID